MAIYAVIDTSGTIINRIVLDDLSIWTPEPTHTIVLEPTTGYHIGATLIDGVYTPPPEYTPLVVPS